ncbi:spore gernimation protein GerQ [Lysinibacillus odysseyi 34hs-1 = NBRC 100172]|uniref:Spore gernimation protein GerQ n=2 Tax=Lysinibacillus odysseyi TaxID=202611 RepID=A0A0A3JFD8_9BACI|nr:spore coat protein GerQ [Lysinibacillus odysseyi]KGR85742.1 spore gernimation protein GerQ [Lysinibacillus odysseyi 34hs-1 = NBRC 100172]
MTYYWTPQNVPQQFPGQQFPGQQMPGQQMQPQTVAQFREESYIENIFRLNRGKPGTFYFSFDQPVDGSNTKGVRGVVEAAGRDHVILRELRTNHRFLFPMIYFDYAEFDEELAYFNQQPQPRP